MEKVLIIGSPGAGKSTLAFELSVKRDFRSSISISSGGMRAG